jgi:hypothetical protein
MECTKDNFAYPNYCKCEKCEKNRASGSNDLLCVWSQMGYEYGDTFETTCGNAFVFIEGSPEENDMHYCCYCGKSIKQVLET